MHTTRIVRKLYPKDLKHICNKLRCDRNVRTSNVSEEKRYRTINPMHVGVKLLDKHGRAGDRDVIQWFLSLTMNDRGKVGVGKVQQNDLAFQMNAMSREVLRKCLKGIIITELDMRRWGIRRWRSTGTKRVPGWSGFTFRCQAASNIPSILKRKYICMGNAWTCDMQNKLHHGLSPIQIYQHTNTSKCMTILL